MSRQSELAQLGRVFDSGPLSNRNLIINGAMQVAQRGTSTSGITSTTYGPCDRFRLQLGTMGTWTTEQSTDAPNGFSNSFKATCTTADASPASTDFLSIRQLIEAQNLQQLSFGSAAAKSLTLSFWAKSNKTGTYVAEFKTSDPAPDRTRDVAYTISAANTWEYKVITIEGDTVGVINNDNGLGMEVTWWLGVGSDFSSGTIPSVWTDNNNPDRAVGQVNLADTVGNYFQITGVQLEVGDTATPFEHRSYGQELALCQRYFERIGGNSNYDPIGVGHQRSATESYFHVSFKEMKRAAPSISFSNNVITTDRLNFDQVVSAIGVSEPSVHGFHGNFNHSSVGATYRPIMITSGPNTPFGYMDLDAEL